VSEVDRSEEEIQHQVKVSKFFMCKYAVRVADFRTFIEASSYLTDAEKQGGSVIISEKVEYRKGVNWRHGVSGNVRDEGEENHPVLHVSWNDAVAYCTWMTETMGKPFRLPTEAEREYACRAGSRTPFNTGENLSADLANFDGSHPYNNSPTSEFRKNTVAVDAFAPNAFGLYTMHGNVWEWCGDWYDENYYATCKEAGTVTDPPGPVNGSTRVLRGGCWSNYGRYCRSANRSYDNAEHHHGHVGFRLVFVP